MDKNATLAMPALSLIDILCQRARHSPEKEAYVFLRKEQQAPQTLTYRELDQRARVLAAHLQRQVAPGERALLFYPSSLEYIIAFFGCLYAGVIAVPVYPPHGVRPHYTMPRLKAIANDAQASVALTTSSLLTKNAFLFDEWLGGEGQVKHWIATDKVDERVSQDWQQRTLSGDSIAFLQYTSGSTATPKGVMLTHKNLLANAKMHQEACQSTEQSIYCSWLPFYHDMGLIAHIIQTLYIGSTCILMSPMSFIQRPAFWLETISRYRVHISGGPNFAYDLCVQRISSAQRCQLDLSSWQIAFMGAEPIRAQTLKRFAETFAECGFRRETFFPCYGLAEATVACTGKELGKAPILCRVASKALREGKVVVAEREQEGTQTIVGCGKTVQDDRVVIVHPKDETLCAPGQVGEIWVAGPHVAKGYWARPEETARTFHAFLRDTGEGPFLRTGDLGFFLDGELFIVGRLKDLIIIDGTNYYPQDIELVIEQCHPALRPGCCAAFSVDIQGEERLVIVAEVEGRYVPVAGEHVQDLRSSGITSNTLREPLSLEATVRTIQRAVHEHFEIPAATVVLIKAGTIPKTTSGKLQRRACREEFLNQRLNRWGK